MTNDKADKVIQEPFDSPRYQSYLEFMKDSVFVFDCTY